MYDMQGNGMNEVEVGVAAVGASSGAGGVKSSSAFLMYKVLALFGVSTVSMFLGAVVVFLLSTPKTTKELVAAIISTVVSSLGGGCAFIAYFGLHAWIMHDTAIEIFIGMMGLGGILFLFALPGWAIVKMIFITLNQQSGKSLFEIYDEIKRRMQGK